MQHCAMFHPQARRCLEAPCRRAEPAGQGVVAKYLWHLSCYSRHWGRCADRCTLGTERQNLGLAEVRRVRNLGRGCFAMCAI
eukprot:6198570-Alexandrium_andersonii.AAC.1